MAPNKRTHHEQHCIENAEYFTTIRGAKTPTRLRREFSTIAEARCFAATFGDRRTMIYAVTPFGSSAHIENA